MFFFHTFTKLARGERTGLRPGLALQRLLRRPIQQRVPPLSRQKITSQAALRAEVHPDKSPAERISAG